jgi:NAD(P)-dependent dehydrogenase (short-subunit alcohol dehydrogenase family)
MKLQGKVAIITGAGSGIGRAIALRFARDGASTALADIDRDALRKVSHEIEDCGAPPLLIPSDVSEPSDAERIVNETVTRFGSLHVLVNNAATTNLRKHVVEMSVEDWDRCLDVSLRSVFMLAKWGAPEMRAAGGGAIINIGSVGGIVPWAGGAAYCAAKGGILALTKVLAIEYGPWNIRVNTLSPGAIMTPNLEEAIRHQNHLERLKARSVLGRVGEAEEVAAAAAFLASDEASFVTASNLLVDGGYLTGMA